MRIRFEKQAPVSFYRSGQITGHRPLGTSELRFFPHHNIEVHPKIRLPCPQRFPLGGKQERELQASPPSYSARPVWLYMSFIPSMPRGTPSFPHPPMPRVSPTSQGCWRSNPRSQHRVRGLWLSRTQRRVRVRAVKPAPSCEDSPTLAQAPLSWWSPALWSPALWREQGRCGQGPGCLGPLRVGTGLDLWPQELLGAG